MELKIEHIAPYLPYSLKWMGKHNITYNTAWMSTKKLAFIDVNGYGDVQKLSWSNASGKIKPLLRPLSDLTKEIEHNGEMFVPYAEIESLDDNTLWDAIEGCFYDQQTDVNYDEGISSLPYWIVKKLHEWHFDTANLIEKGLALDKNKLKQGV